MIQSSYPIYFEEEEAYFYENSLFCGNPAETKKYKNLTCSLKTLDFVEQLLFEDIGANYWKQNVYKCKKCDTLWLLKEEYDSQRGFSYLAEIYLK